MKTTLIHHPRPRFHPALAIGALLSFVLMACVPIAQAGEFIPSVGLTRSARGDDDNAQLYGGVAFRGKILPIVRGEVGVAYHSDRRLGGDLVVRQWPVTGSLWLAPIRQIYAGGGVGWYHTTLDYASTVPATDVTHQRFGVHLGGGVEVPVAPSTALDFNGRYVFLKSEQSQLPPDNFDPDYWSATVGLAFHF